MTTRLPRATLAAVVPFTAAAILISIGQPAGAAPVSAWPAHYAAPYLQIGSGTAGDMADDMAATGLKQYTLAFLIPQEGCTAQWEYNGDPVGAFTSQINALKDSGGDVILSFGGAAGGELAQTCTSVPDLTAAYAGIVNTYGVTRLDFDIEGATLDDTAANTRRNQALTVLQAQNPSVQVDYTLAVAPDGLPSAQTALLQDAKDNGVNVSTVNLMTMDFGNGHNALSDAESAAQATAGQLATLYGVSNSQAYQMMGLTPIAGQNDDDEFFSQSDAAALENFAASHGVGELAFWEVDGYDKPTGYAYSSTFNQIDAPSVTAHTRDVRGLPASSWTG
ncbi:chitinase [Streptomyces sp. NPDC001709]